MRGFRDSSLATSWWCSRATQDRKRQRVALCQDHDLVWQRPSGPNGHRPGRDDAESHGERIYLPVLSHLPIRKSHHVQPCQSQSVHQVPGCRRRHEALRRAGDLTTGRQQGGGQYRFQFGFRDGFGDWIEHQRRLHFFGVQNKNTKASTEAGVGLLEI
jgi:hypothetical protein